MPRQSETRATTRRRWRPLVVVLAVVVVIVGLGIVVVPRMVPERYLPWNTAAFPETDRTSLTELQGRVLDELEGQYEDPQPGVFYSEGVRQPWCANFVSWIMERAGAPYVNPNSGHWRIPGVLTLREYFVGEGRFVPPDVGYVPQTGDVVLYISPVIGEHTNMVVSADPETGTAITLGGNERGAVRLHHLRWQDDSAVVGYGQLPASA